MASCSKCGFVITTEYLAAHERLCGGKVKATAPNIKALLRDADNACCHCHSVCQCWAGKVARALREQAGEIERLRRELLIPNGLLDNGKIADERDALQARVRELEQQCDTWINRCVGAVSLLSDELRVGELQSAVNAVAALRAECEGLRKDAERYRWLRENDDADVQLLDYNEDGSTDAWYQHHTEALDAAIDAAMAAGT